MYDVIIIGAGIIGGSIARELSRYNLNILILEKENDIANGTTKANSAIIHAGYDAKPNTNKARFNVDGNRMFDKICEELDVPFKRVGSLVVAFNTVENDTIGEIYERGIQNKVEGLRILNRNELVELEPNISDEAVSALYAPSGGIIGPWELAIGLIENAMDNGVKLSLNSKVTNIDKIENGYKVYTEDKEYETKYIINCAGLYADEVHKMVAPPKFKISPRKGQYFLLDKSVGGLLNTVVFQCPSELGKGIVVLPTVHGNLLVGPDAVDIDNKENKETSKESFDAIRQAGLKSCNKIPLNAVITSFAGLRAKSDADDFIVEEAEGAKGFIDVAGIESPGLTSAPAIAEYVVNLLKGIDGNFIYNDKFNPIRRKIVRFIELTSEEKKEMVKKDSRYGRIICRCENITEGEIVDSIHRNAGARTIDGVKRRVRPGSGRCQGGFCQPRVLEILARELDVDIREIVKDGPNSNIVIGETK